MLETFAAAIAVVAAVSVGAGQPVNIDCTPKGGGAFTIENVIHLSAGQCHRLERIVAGEKVKRNKLVRTLAVISVEAAHVNGISDNNLATCWAILNAKRMGKALGLPKGLVRKQLRKKMIAVTHTWSPYWICWESYANPPRLVFNERR